jgi:hypothetical protein
MMKMGNSHAHVCINYGPVDEFDKFRMGWEKNLISQLMGISFDDNCPKIGVGVGD